jgi:hypothetical protein
MELPFDFDLSKVTRLVVIDYDGNSYEKWNIVIDKVSLQDNDRTLKIFVGVKDE